jgi:alkylation response protein AidB-like acyl-CoA dehydrogenase
VTTRVDEARARVDHVGAVARRRADDSERMGQLDDEVVEALHETGLFHLNLPPERGGLDLTLPESVEALRRLSSFDGSTGWVMSILGSGPLFGRFLEQDAFDELFADPRAVIAGSLNPLGGVAEPTADGYCFTGRATYVSGCRHASWLMAGAWVHRDGEKSWIDGRPEMIAGLLPMADATIERTWATSGMRATGSDDCAYVAVEVPQRRTFTWPEPAAKVAAGPISRIPMLVQLGGGAASTIVGAARGAQDHFVELARSKRPTGTTSALADRSYAHMAVGEAEGLILAAEDALARGMEEIWVRAEHDGAFDDALRLRLRLRTVTAARLAIRAVDLLHDAAGMDGVSVSSPLERAWRDVHTASQHVVLNVGRIEVAGRRLLGVDPGSPII